MGHLHREAGPRCWGRHHLPVGGRIPEVAAHTTRLCFPTGKCSSCSVPCREIGAIFLKSVLFWALPGCQELLWSVPVCVSMGQGLGQCDMVFRGLPGTWPRRADSRQLDSAPVRTRVFTKATGRGWSAQYLAEGGPWRGGRGLQAGRVDRYL